MNKHISLLAFLTAVTCCALSQQPQCAETAALPAWQPDKNLLGSLEAASPIGEYELRSPKGYERQRQQGPDSADAVAWVTPERKDGTRAYVMVGRVEMPAAEIGKYTLEQLLDGFLKSVQRRRKKDWKRSKTERGTINGITFVRARWSGTAAGAKFKMHGFHYLTVVGDKVFQLSSQDVEPHHKKALPLAECSVLTFQKKGDPKQ